MNRNRKLRKQMMSGLAVGMAAVMGALRFMQRQERTQRFPKKKPYM